MDVFSDINRHNNQHFSFGVIFKNVSLHYYSSLVWRNLIPTLILHDRISKYTETLPYHAKHHDPVSMVPLIFAKIDIIIKIFYPGMVILVLYLIKYK